MEIFTIITLSLSGLLLFFVGLMRLSSPLKTYLEKSGIQLTKDPNLLNEMRGVSSLMMCAGILIILGTYFTTFTFTSILIATLFFCGFGIGRIVSVIVDGKPNPLLNQGLISELILGIANILCLIYLPI